MTTPIPSTDWSRAPIQQLLANLPPPPSPERRVALQLQADRGLGVDPRSLGYHYFAVFMAQLRDEAGATLSVEPHHEQWAALAQECDRLCCVAPRDHGKTILFDAAYVLWRAWRHNRDPETLRLRRPGPDGALPEGILDVILASATQTQAKDFFAVLQGLALANEALFADVLPQTASPSKTALRRVWATTHLTLTNGVQVRARSFRGAARGLHPHLLVVDDALDERNSATAAQREKVWRTFQGVWVPMMQPGGQIIVVGTPQHFEDLLFRLREAPGWTWRRYRAVDWSSRRVLWAARHDLADLEEKRDTDVLLFSREYLCEPRDDRASLFPRAVTGKAIAAGRGLRFLDSLDLTERSPGEIVVGSMDSAMSEAVGADYLVLMIARLDPATMRRTIIHAVREKGLGFEQQVGLLRWACRAFGVECLVMEHNSFQRWVYAEVQKYPETAGRVYGHQTGIEKQSLKDGVPSLLIGLRAGFWVLPDGIDHHDQEPEVKPEVVDRRASEFAAVWQSEHQAFGWVDDKLQGAGEHDDTVMATWLLDRAVRIVQAALQRGPAEEIVDMGDVGIERVRIGSY